MSSSVLIICFFFSSRRRHTRWPRDWSSDVCSSDLGAAAQGKHLWARIDAVQRVYELVHRLPQADAQVDTRGQMLLQVAEIGRASCRERVWKTQVAEWVKTI